MKFCHSKDPLDIWRNLIRNCIQKLHTLQEPEQQQRLEKYTLFNLKNQTPSHPFQVIVQIDDKDVVMEIDTGESISLMWPDRKLPTSKTA